MQSSVQLKGYLFIAMAAVLWGLLGPISKLALAEGIAPLEIAFWRGVLAWILFGGQALWFGQTAFYPRDIPALLLFALTGVTMFYGSYQLAVQSGGAALAAVLLYTAPAWVAVMARIFFMEPLTPIKLGAVALTMTGVASISLGNGNIDGSVNFPAILFGLTAGFCYSMYYVLGKPFSKGYTAPNLFLYLLPIGSLFLAPFVPFSSKTPVAWLALIAIAFVCTYLAYHSYYAGLKLLQASRASIVATLEPVSAAVVAYFWWGETFSLLGWLGAAAILAAVLLTVREKDTSEAE
jgi:drug/metabolite transporter (DMT)-like permease